MTITATMAFAAVALLGTVDEDARRFYREGDVANPVGCAMCHGVSGEGRREGGAIVPAIAGRSDYRDGDFARLLATGMARDGRRLSLMPQYTMRAIEAKALNRYLAILGGDRDGDPGLHPHTITIGAALPFGGARSNEAEAMANRLMTSVDAVNRAGGIYGRQIVLRVVNAIPANRTALADCFIVLVSPLSFAAPGQPLVGALASSDDQSGENPDATFYLLPPRPQLDRLLAHVGEARVGPYLAEVALEMTIRGLEAGGRTINRARFVKAIEAVRSVRVAGRFRQPVEIGFLPGRHVASTVLVAAPR